MDNLNRPTPVSPRLLSGTCPRCGLRLTEKVPSDHPFNGMCPRCGEAIEHEEPDV